VQWLRLNHGPAAQLRQWSNTLVYYFMARHQLHEVAQLVNVFSLPPVSISRAEIGYFIWGTCLRTRFEEFVIRSCSSSLLRSPTRYPKSDDWLHHTATPGGYGGRRL
jgi:hypothetical protein